MPTLHKPVTRLVVATLVAIVCAGPVSAGLLPTQVTITPEAGNFRWTYAVVLPSDMKLQSGDYFTVYNFAGLVDGSPLAPDGWTVSTPGVSPNPDHVSLIDNPETPNLIWTYNGPTIPSGQIGLGNFSASSVYGESATTLFVGHNARAGDGIYDTNVTDTLTPVGLSIPPTPGVPEPATLALAGLGLPLIGIARRIRRRERATP